MKKSIMNENILEKTKFIIAKHLFIDEQTIKPESDVFKELDADSLDRVEIIMHLEYEFEISIPDTEMENAKTVQDFANIVQNNKSK